MKPCPRHFEVDKDGLGLAKGGTPSVHGVAVEKGSDERQGGKSLQWWESSNASWRTPTRAVAIALRRTSCSCAVSVAAWQLVVRGRHTVTLILLWPVVFPWRWLLLQTQTHETVLPPATIRPNYPGSSLFINRFRAPTETVLYHSLQEAYFNYNWHSFSQSHTHLECSLGVDDVVYPTLSDAAW